MVTVYIPFRKRLHKSISFIVQRRYGVNES